MPKQPHYVIIGGGVAGISAAKAIRDRQEAAEISIFAEESALPYNRVKLSKNLFTDLHSDSVLIKKEKWYSQNNITCHSDTRVIAIDPGSKTVATEDGRTVSYDKLLLCTGAVNRKLNLEGGALPHVHNIRSRNDADKLKSALRAGDRVCVIGGGIQGVETAWSLNRAGYAVTIVEAAPRLMARQLDERASALLTAKITGLGSEIRLGQGVLKIVDANANSGKGVELADGSFVPCEHVVYSIGIIPNTTLAGQSGLETGTGVIVNERMQTSNEHIYAAGDVTELHGKMEGLWNSAMEQGKVAGANMAGGDAVYRRPVPMTVSTAFDTPLFSIGLVDEQQCDSSISGPSAAPYKRIFIKNSRVCGAVVFDNVIAALPYKTAIEQALEVSEADLAASSLEELLEKAAAALQ